MRATKLIKEYVTKKVHEAYPETAEELAWYELKDKMEEAKKKATTIIKDYAETVIAELNVENGFEDEYALEIYNRLSMVSCGSCNKNKVYLAYYEAREKRIEKIAETIEEILINLELGGTRKDLDEMLANIGK